MVGRAGVSPGSSVEDSVVGVIVPDSDSHGVGVGFKRVFRFQQLFSSLGLQEMNVAEVREVINEHTDVKVPLVSHAS